MLKKIAFIALVPLTILKGSDHPAKSNLPTIVHHPAKRFIAGFINQPQTTPSYIKTKLVMAHIPLPSYKKPHIESYEEVIESAVVYSTDRLRWRNNPYSQVCETPYLEELIEKSVSPYALSGSQQTASPSKYRGNSPLMSFTPPKN